MKLKITNTLAKICAVCASLATLARIIIYFVIPKQVIRLYVPLDDMNDVIMRNYPMLAISVLIAIVFIVACILIERDVDGTNGFRIGIISLVLYFVFIYASNILVGLVPNMLAADSKQVATMMMLDSTATRVQAVPYKIMLASLCFMIGTHIKKIESVKQMCTAVATLSGFAIMAEVLSLYVFPDSMLEKIGFHIKYDTEAGRMILPESITDIMLAVICIIMAIIVIKFFTSETNKLNDSIVVCIDYRKIYWIIFAMFIIFHGFSLLNPFVNMLSMRVVYATKTGDELTYYIGLRQLIAWVQALVLPIIGCLIGISFGASYKATR